ncbi:hypothetical protein [Dyadobacter sp. LHD-138]|uniref:hypothetical protein n=1 Tax=Dyadobacter sp. LHD-138 TaxID=3071413 RepID=UPI0027E1899B|nr:hypothetical protein [Dyadobacter sp. LHD-138]MDQ6478607.1 hypothetical protein [Dyadobacter sp. LHD-138]
MKRVIACIILVSLLTQCVSKETKLQGTWRTDSISTFVNGFTHTNNSQDEHWSHFEYNSKGEIFERRKAEFRKYNYKVLSSDSLVYLDSAGSFLTGYKILKLNDKQLVLKKIQKPYLPGKNQTLYETRFFSKILPDHISASK